MADQKPTAPRIPNRAWHAAEANGMADAKLSRGRRLVHVMTVIVALVGVLAGLLFYLRSFRQPAFLMIPITEYGDPRLPPNAQSGYDHDSNELCRIVPSCRFGFDMQQSNHLVNEISTWAADKKAGFAFYLSALAAVKDGSVFLLPAQARADDPRSWRPLEDVVRAFRESPIKNKVLILDAMPGFADARLGILSDGVAEQIEKLLTQPENRDVYVLCACEAGQVSLPARFLHRTLFDYYLVEGLRGGADGYGPNAKKNQRVSLRELAAFVRQRVDRWAQRIYQRRQTPRLFGPDQGDFELGLASDDAATVQSRDVSRPAYPPDLAEGWNQYDQWRQAAPSYAPQIIRKLGARLLRAEARWRAGRSWDKESQELRDATRTLKAAYESAEAITNKDLPAVPREDAEAGALLKKFLMRHDSPKDTDIASVKEAFLKQRTKNVLDRDLAWTLIAEAVNALPLAVHHLQLAHELYGQLKVAETWQSPRLWDTVLSLQATKKVLIQEPELVASAFRAQFQADKVGSIDPRVFPWIRPLLEQAAQARRQGIELFTAGRFTQAREPLQRAEQLYGQASRLGELLREMQAASDRAMLIVPACEAYILRRAREDAELENTWRTTSAAAGSLFVALDATTATSAPTTEMRRSYDAIHDGLVVLSRPFSSDSITALCQRAQMHSADGMVLADIEALLGTPLPLAKDRVRLWEAGFDLERRLAERIVEEDRNDDRAPRTGARAMETESGQRGRALTEERNRALHRAELSLVLLDLGGLDPQESADVHAKHETVRQAQDSALDGLASALQTAWSRRPKVEEKLLARDRWSRVMDPLNPDLSPSESVAFPTAAFRHQEVVQFTSWLRDRLDRSSALP